MTGPCDRLPRFSPCCVAHPNKPCQEQEEYQEHEDDFKNLFYILLHFLLFLFVPFLLNPPTFIPFFLLFLISSSFSPNSFSNSLFGNTVFGDIFYLLYSLTPLSFFFILPKFHYFLSFSQYYISF